VAVYDDGRWKDLAELDVDLGRACATESELHLLESGADEAVWSVQLDDGTATTSPVPPRSLPDIAPRAELACDRMSAVLVSTAADQSSNMTLQRLRAGAWVEEEVADSRGSIPRQVFSGDAGIVVLSSDRSLGRTPSTSGARMIRDDGAVTAVPVVSMTYVVPGLSDGRVAFIGGARLEIRTFAS
jgi:hypothetical protein